MSDTEKPLDLDCDHCAKHQPALIARVRELEGQCEAIAQHLGLEHDKLLEARDERDAALARAVSFCKEPDDERGRVFDLVRERDEALAAIARVREVCRRGCGSPIPNYADGYFGATCNVKAALDGDAATKGKQ